MIESKKIAHNLINLVLSAFLSFSLSYALTSSLVFDYKSYEIFLLGFILTCICYCIFYNRLALKISGIVLGASAVIAAVILALSGKLVRLTLGISSFVTWVLDYTQGYDTINKLYQPYLTLIVCIIISLIVFFFTIKKFNFWVLLAGGVSIFSAQWMYSIFVSYLSFYSFLLFILIYYFIYIHNKNTTRERNAYVDRSIFALWMLPVSLIVVLTCLLIPAKDTPVQFPWLDKKINSVYAYFNNAYKNYKSFEFFSIESTGFGENSSRLGGKVRLDKTLVMKVEAPKVIYLRGEAREIYTGTRWSNTEKTQTPLYDDAQIHNDELYEMLLGFRLLTGDTDYISKYFDTYDVKISYRNLLMKTIFSPIKTNNISFANNKSYQAFIDQNSILSSKNISNKNFEYSLKAYNIEYDNKDFQNIIRGSKARYYADILKRIDLINKQIVSSYNSEAENNGTDNGLQNNFIDMFYNLSFNDISWIMRNINPDNPEDTVIPPNVNFQLRILDDSQLNPNPQLHNINFVTYHDLKQLSAISERIYDTYLQLPEKLPARVKTLAASVTASKKNNYDKVKAIEDYLSGNYSYTLTPKQGSRHRDFVDYFLFEGKEGYCTYFATAMAVMVRSIGIPARYVEGYILPANPKTGKTYEVTNEQAHAWVEVYFDGFGWLPFEPTSPFKSSFYDGKPTKANFSQSFAGNSAYEEYLRHLQGYGNTNLNLNFDQDDIAGEKSENKSVYYIAAVIILVGLLVFAFVFLVLYHLFKGRYMLYNLSLLEPRDCILQMYRYYMRVLSVLGYPIKPGETPAQFSQRVDSFVIFDKPDAFRTITDKFVLARYSTNKISEKEKKLVSEFYDNMIRVAKYELGKYKYFFKRFILGRL